MLLQVEGEVIEIRPGEIFESSGPVDSRYLEEILPHKVIKKGRPKKEPLVVFDGSSTQS
jgi:hypothetical protein